jgi:hypothetical protein
MARSAPWTREPNGQAAWQHFVRGRRRGNGASVRHSSLTMPGTMPATFQFDETTPNATQHMEQDPSRIDEYSLFFRNDAGFAKPLYGLKPVPRVRIPASPPVKLFYPLIFPSETLPSKMSQNSVRKTADPAGESHCRAPPDSGAYSAASSPAPDVRRVPESLVVVSRASPGATRTRAAECVPRPATASLDLMRGPRGTAPSGASNGWAIVRDVGKNSCAPVSNMSVPHRQLSPRTH